MLSRTAEYALRAVLFVAGRSEGRPMRVEEVADAIGAPRNYLSKTMHILARDGILTSTRGPRGGFTLAVPAHRLKVSRVIASFDEPRTSGVCLLGDRPCDALHPCAAHGRWAAILHAAREPLATTTIAQLLGADVRAESVPVPVPVRV